MIIIVMGVSGAGKSTVGEELAQQLQFAYCDADDLHPAHNRDKMARGIALTDEDRQPWLASLLNLIESARLDGRDLVIACSALKRSYRDALRGPETTFVFLRITAEVARQRLAGRVGHFFDPKLLDSQFAALEPPSRALTIDAEQTPGEIVAEIASSPQVRRG